MAASKQTISIESDNIKYLELIHFIAKPHESYKNGNFVQL